MSFEVEIREHRPSELRTLVAVAARAFWDDPLFNFFAPDFYTQHRSLGGFFHAGIGDASRHGRVWVAERDGMPIAVAAWLPPGVLTPKNGRRAWYQTRHALPTIARSPQRRSALALMNELPKHHIRERHWYLAVLATDPKFQGRGIGTRLLAPVLAECDRSGLPAYLETQKEENLPYYGRFGFEVAEVVRVRNSPAVWTMQRTPQLPD
jgi:GNAT superfamily N-acetyltransferase